MDKISIIVPIYNTEKYLSECLDSVLSQTHKNFEAILIDDGSTDKSLSIAELYAKNDSRFKIIHQENQGLFAARNSGLKEVTGDWITFLDSDDILAPVFLEILLEYAKSNHSEIAISFHQPFFDSNSLKKIKTNKNRPCLTNGKEALKNALYQKKIPDYSAWNKLYSAKLWKDKVFKPRKFAEDLATIPEILFEAKQIVITKTPLYFYRKRRDSLLATPYNQDKAELLEIAEEVLQKFSQDIDLKPAAESTLLSASFSILWKVPETEEFFKIREKAFHYVKKLRTKVLLNPQTRFRNKVACVISYFGKNVLLYALRRFG